MRDSRSLVLLFSPSPHVRASERDDVPSPAPRDPTCSTCKGLIPSGRDIWCSECQLTGHEFDLHRERRQAELEAAAVLLNEKRAEAARRRAEYAEKRKADMESRRKRKWRTSAAAANSVNADRRDRRSKTKAKGKGKSKGRGVQAA